MLFFRARHKIFPLFFAFVSAVAAASVPFPGGVLYIRAAPPNGETCANWKWKGTPSYSVQYWYNRKGLWRITKKGNEFPAAEIKIPENSGMGFIFLDILAKNLGDDKYPCVSRLEFDPEKKSNVEHVLNENKIFMGSLKKAKNIWYWSY